jgi:hypothetical protein
MKASEIQADFVHEQPRTAAPAWLATPVDYTNREYVSAALRALSPDWDGFAPPVPDLTTLAAPTTAIVAVVGDVTPDLALLLHDGR